MDYPPIVLLLQSHPLVVSFRPLVLLQHSGWASLQHSGTGLMRSSIMLHTPTLTFDPSTSTHPQAFELLLKALIRACGEQLRPFLQELQPMYVQHILAQPHTVDPPPVVLLELTPHLFLAPAQLSFLPSFLDSYGHWLTEYWGFSPEKAQALVRAFPKLLKSALVIEWCARTSYYDPVQSLFAHPWRPNLESEQQKVEYEHELKEGMYTLALGEKQLPLHYIYVAPDFMVYQGHRQEASLQKDHFSTPKPQLLPYLIEKIIRTRISDSKYWKALGKNALFCCWVNRAKAKPPFVINW